MAWFRSFLKRTDQIGTIQTKSLASTISLGAFMFFIATNTIVLFADLIFSRAMSITTQGFLTTTTTAGLIPAMLYIFGGAWGYCTEKKHRHSQTQELQENNDQKPMT